MLRKLTFIFAALLGIMFSSASAQSCQCALPPSLPEAYESSELVFTARIASIEMKGGGETVEGITRPGAWFEVIKSYKGRLKPIEKIFFESGKTSCSYKFDNDWKVKEILVFTNGLDKANHGDLKFCGRAGSADSSNPDIRYLENIEKYRGHTRLSGSFTLPEYFDEDAKASFKSAKIMLTGGEKPVFLDPDKDGVFELYDLAPGTYWAEVSIAEPDKYIASAWNYSAAASVPKYFRERGSDPVFIDDAVASKSDPPNRFRITVRNRRHYDLPLVFGANNSLTGHFRDKSKQPLEGMMPSLVRADKKDEAKFVLPQEYIPLGKFSFRNVVPGEYYLRITQINDGKLDPNFKLYYPGTIDRAKAVKIKIAAGQHIKDLIFRVPPGTTGQAGNAN